jgi:hypothetical protein
MNYLRLIRELFNARGELAGLLAWRHRAYTTPAPPAVKRAVLLRQGMHGAVWVETGTYLGETTSCLANHSPMVYSIEPEPTLYAQAAEKFRDRKNIRIIHGTSEEALPELVAGLTGDVNFWLDGHYSAGITFKGSSDTPIKLELAAVARALPRLGRVVVLIDDMRCFEPSAAEFSQYPTRGYLVNWAEEAGLNWQIEHDIFVAKNH